LRISANKLVEQANAEIVTVSIKEAVLAREENRAVVVDLRDIRELQKTGRIPGAVHAPRGMLEFWVDPENEYYREVFGQNDKTYLFICAAAWRSALATKAVQDMGMKNVAHIEGGFTAWKDEGAPVEMMPERKK
jgi:rhodanese-related sulfurtransferase